MRHLIWIAALALLVPACGGEPQDAGGGAKDVTPQTNEGPVENPGETAGTPDDTPEPPAAATETVTLEIEGMT